MLGTNNANLEVNKLKSCHFQYGLICWSQNLMLVTLALSLVLELQEMSFLWHVYFILNYNHKFSLSIIHMLQFNFCDVVIALWRYESFFLFIYLWVHSIYNTVTHICTRNYEIWHCWFCLTRQNWLILLTPSQTPLRAWSDNIFSTQLSVDSSR